MSLNQTVAVIGQGYVGLSVACAAAAAGLTVVGIDTDVHRVSGLGRGELVVPGVDRTLFARSSQSGRMTFTSDFSACAAADVVLICVPTPVEEHRPDLSMVEAAAAAAAPHLRPGALVILESTVYAGTTDGVLKPILEQHAIRAGSDLLVAFAPERIDPGNSDWSFNEIPRVVGGIDQRSTEAAVSFYEQLVDRVVPVTSARAAELSKLLENTYRMVNIALANEFAILCRDQDIDPWEVIGAANSKPFGFMPFFPGPGVGGHCIPIDPTYLTWQSRRDRGRPIRLVELAQDINAEMPRYVADRMAELLNDRSKSVRGSHIFIIGVTYKPDVGDLRESAPLAVMRQLSSRGARLSFHDPFVERVQVGDSTLLRVDLDDEVLRNVDLVGLLTPHSTYDLEQIVGSSALLFDARNATGGASGAIVL